MFKVSKILVYITILFTISGCFSLREISVDTIIPATITIPPEIKTLAIINNTPVLANKQNCSFTVKVVDLINNQEVYNERDTLKCDSLSLACVRNVYNVISGSNFFNNVNLVNNGINYYLKKNLTDNDYNQILSKNNADASLILDEFTSENSLIGYKSFDYYNGLEIRTIVKAKWVYFDISAGHSLKFFNICDTLFWDIESDAQSPSYRQNISIESAWKSGETTAMKIVPSWHTEKRFLISGNSTYQFVLSKYNQGQIEDAIRISEALFSQKGKNNKIICAYNLAVLNEIKGDITMANKWMEISESYLFKTNKNNFLKTVVEEYKKTLTTRKNELKRVQKQYS